MKMVRRLMAVVLAATILTGIGMPVQTQAASKPKVVSVRADEIGSNYAYLLVGTRGGKGQTEQYRYRVYVNGKLSKQGTSTYYTVAGSSKRYCKVETPGYCACTVRVKAKRGGVWSKWSDYAAIVPKVKVTSATSTGNSFTLKWKKIPGATDYVVYTKKKGTGSWVKEKTVKGTNAKINTSSYPINTTYSIRVMARRKLKGKYMGSISWTQYSYYRYRLK